MASQEVPNNGSTSPLYRGVIGPALTIGFAAAVVMWMLAWILWKLFISDMRVPLPVAIPILLLPLLITCLIWLPGVSKPNRLAAGALAGFIAGLVNLLILGSSIVEQPETTAEMGEKANALAPNAFLVIFGSLAVSLLIGLTAAVIVRGGQAETISGTRWRSRFAWVTGMTYLPLIAVGGIVTSTDSGLAVPDAVTSYGAISVLFPLKLMAEPRIFFEHSHRLFGTLAGLTTLVLMVRLLAFEPRKWAKALGVILFLAVSAQGILGIVRVSEMSTAYAIIHGVFAQLVFALALLLAFILSPRWIGIDPAEETVAIARKARTWMLLAVIALTIQLVLGAVTRHLNSSHAMMSHLGFAFIAMMIVIVGGAVCIRTGKTQVQARPLRNLGVVLHALITLQFAVGFAVLGIAWEGEDAPEIPTAQTLAEAHAIDPAAALVTTIHHVNGALVLAAAICALAWAVHLASRRRIG